jgi:penicillin-binding protein 1A
LTQQLAKNLFPRQRHGLLSMPVNKCREAIIAKRLEKVYSKKEILTLYLNTVPFGEDVYGINVAAQRFLSTDVAHLNIEQSALLAGLEPCFDEISFLLRCLKMIKSQKRNTTV